jgi:hypothetical protein
LLLAGCSADLSGVPTVSIQLRAVFSRSLPDLDFEWSGQMVASQYPRIGVTHFSRSDIVTDIVPGETRVGNNDAEQLQPGVWNVTVEAFETASDGGSAPATSVLSAHCVLRDIGQTILTHGEPYVIRVTEDGSCVSDVASSLPPIQQKRDVEAVSVVVASAKPIPTGQTVPIILTFMNNGSRQESVQVSATARPVAGGEAAFSDSTALTVDAGKVNYAKFDWDTRCLQEGAYTVTATAAIPEDDVPDNNTATDKVSLATTRRLDIAFADNTPTTVVRGTPVALTAAVTAGPGDPAGESAIQLAFTDTGTTPGNFAWSPSQTVSHLDCGASTNVTLIYQAGPVPAGTSEDHTFRVRIVQPVVGGNAMDSINAMVTAP